MQRMTDPKPNLGLPFVISLKVMLSTRRIKEQCYKIQEKAWAKDAALKKKKLHAQRMVSLAFENML